MPVDEEMLIYIQSLSRLGANTVGIDASGSNIAIASLHASADPSFRLTSSTLPTNTQSSATARNSLTYLHTTTDALLAPESSPESPVLPSVPQQFDVVSALEVLEHVSNPPHFLDTCASLVKPGGHLFISTMARTPLAYALTILFAEHISGKVTKGTHTWSKYVNPEELVDFFKTYPANETELERKWIEPAATSYLPRHQAELKGLIYNPLNGSWHLAPRNSIAGAQCNYIFWVRKPKVATDV